VDRALIHPLAEESLPRRGTRAPWHDSGAVLRCYGGRYQGERALRSARNPSYFAFRLVRRGQTTTARRAGAASARKTSGVGSAVSAPAKAIAPRPADHCDRELTVLCHGRYLAFTRSFPGCEASR